MTFRASGQAANPGGSVNGAGDQPRCKVLNAQRTYLRGRSSAYITELAYTTNQPEPPEHSPQPEETETSSGSPRLESTLRASGQAADPGGSVNGAGDQPRCKVLNAQRTDLRGRSSAYITELANTRNQRAPPDAPHDPDSSRRKRRPLVSLRV